MSSDAKTQILDRIRSALADAPPVPEVERTYRRASDLPQEQILEMLDDRLTDYRATVHRATLSELPQVIGSLLPETARFVVPGGLDPAWLPADPSRQAVRDAPTGDGTPLTVRELNEMDAVITASTVTCAETGTIFLSGLPTEGRRAISLVPDHHVCVVPVETVVELFPEAISRITPTAPITMISGPSATSDIELERVEGVHGPRRLDVIFLG